MAEEPNSSDITPENADLRTTDSTRRIVSTNLPTCFSDRETNIMPIKGHIISTVNHLETLANTVNTNLSTHLENMSCTDNAPSDVVHLARITTKADIHFADTVTQRDSPVKLRSTNNETHEANFSIQKVDEKHRPAMEKRKCDSSHNHNAREKLLRFAYKERETKNVSFDLQADEDDNQSVVIEEAVTTMTPSMSVTETTRSSSNVNLPVPLPPRERSTLTGRRQLQAQVQTAPTDEEMRNYIVPERESKMWKLYEHQLRIVGRSQARINQLIQDVEDNNPPSWCFGGSQASQYLRPYSTDLVNITKRYALQMARSAIATLMRQAEDDAGEARHLQETLKRMYREHKDPNFELAIGRAEGIAAHYARKEEALNQ